MLRMLRPSKIKAFLISWIIVICNGLFAQGFTEPSRLKKFNITVNFENYTVKTQMLNQYKKIAVNNERLYMWYTAQKIIETKGGYDGKLIHGTYRAFYLNNQLREKGEVNYGLKHKEWKYWYADGNLKEVITWKNGEKSGPYMLYNDYGQLMAKSRFKKDKLNGNFYTYDGHGKLLDKKKYKNGEEKISKPKVKKQTKVRILRKKDKPDSLEKKNKASGKTSTAKDNELNGKPSFFKRLFKKKDRSKEKSVKPAPVIITS